MELVLKKVAQYLAADTNYASMITSPQYHRTKLKFIQLSMVNDQQLLAVVVAEGMLSRTRCFISNTGLIMRHF